VVFYKFAARRNLVTHECGEYAVGFCIVLSANL
jgi:hypothetical protein